MAARRTERRRDIDSRHFDALTRRLSKAGTRRGVLGLLGDLPILGALLALVDHDDGAAQGRRKRRKKRHKHGKGRHRRRHTPCTAKSKAKTCAGTCGIVTNNCQKKVDCGTCVCDPPCDICDICDRGVCIFRCAPCEVCLGDGSCVHVCDGSDCCDNGICTDGTGDAACGRDGDACVTCTPPRTCGGGNPGTPGVCG